MAERDLTQEQLAAAIGISHSTISRWLSGSSVPYDRTAQKLGAYLGVHWLLLISDVDISTDDAKALHQMSALRHEKEILRKNREGVRDILLSMSKRVEAMEAELRTLRRDLQEARSMAEMIDDPPTPPG